ncbi:MAG TPA: AMP-binding protein [Acidimicrobiales bacterium]|jgi:fatty-acyl-CoA synthase|nr:AMP-binding protein [Acidimicrobiales bacterium]
MNDALARSDLNLATAWEAVARTVPDQPAARCGTVVRPWWEFEERAARLASGLQAAGVRAGSKVAIALYNGIEYLETEFAAMKVRGVPCNVNYRYLAEELRYVLDNADAEAVVFDHTLRDRIDEIRPALPLLRLFVEVGDADTAVPEWAVAYEQLVAAHDPAPPIERHGDDLWFLYTGGTTGMPKAVMWEHRGLFGTMEVNMRPLGHEVPMAVEDVVQLVRDVASRHAEVRQLTASPLMHGTAGISSKSTLTHGGMVAMLAQRSFDADELWRCVEDARITLLTIVGDAFSRPMLDALDRAAAAGRPYDVSSLRSIVSSGVMWSEQVKQSFLAQHDVTLVDVYGSSEGTGMARQVASRTRGRPATARFRLGEHSRVFTDDGSEVEPGSGETGRIALGFPIPLGYYKDPAKTDAAFPTIAGRRWSVPGDYATVEADGTITLLGRGSAVINTGGEKVFPEEVEETIKTYAGVADCIVVGIADERWGQAVVAVVAPRPEVRLAAEDVIAHAKARLAGYKVPKRVVVVDAVHRLANGKPDYPWAREIAEGQRK